MYVLGVGFLKQGTPELVLVCRVHVDELSILRRKPVVHQHLYPLSVLPDTEAKYAWKENVMSCFVVRIIKVVSAMLQPGLNSW